MKKLRILLSAVLLTIVVVMGLVPTTFAEPPHQTGIRTVKNEQTGALTFLGIDTGRQGALPLATGAALSQATALADFSVYSREFGIKNPSEELRLMQSSGKGQGGTSYRYQQMYKDVPILAGEMIINYNTRGQLAAIAGEASPSLSLDVTPNVSAQLATQTALAHVARQENIAVSDLIATDLGLWIYDARLLVRSSALPPTLTRRFEVTSTTGLPIRYLVLVGAKFNGVVLAFNQNDTLIHDLGERGELKNTVPPETGINLPALPNYAYPPGKTCDSHETDDTSCANTDSLVCNTVPSALTGEGSCDGTSTSTAANTAQYFAYNTFNYYDSHHNRNSVDNAGHALNSHVNYTDKPGVPMDNAWWDGKQVVYGSAKFYTADDVAAHEWTHAVTQFTSNLFYFYESGAINEAMSDIFGELIDQWNGIDSFGAADDASDAWLIGEDMYNGADPGSLRNMADPTAYTAISNRSPDMIRSPYYQISDGDNGGVHKNSGVANKAAYLIAVGGTFNGQTITGLGNDKMSTLFYEVNTTLLTSGADYQLLGAALVQACTNLARVGTQGFVDADCVEVEKATLATQMNLDPFSDTTWSPKADLCSTPGTIQTDILFQGDFEMGAGDTLPNFTDTILEGGGEMLQKAPWLAWTEASYVGASNALPTTGDRTPLGIGHPNGYGYIEDNILDEENYGSAFRMNNSVAIPGTGDYYLYFDHAFYFEIYSFNGTTYRPDAGVLEYSTSGASGPWIDAGSLFDDGQNYNGTVSSQTGVTLNGRSAFTADSHGWVSSRYDISPLAGHNVMFRWRIGSDYINRIGWFLDNVQIYSCTPEADLTINLTDLSTETIRTGDPVIYEIVVANDSPGPANNVTVTSSFTGAGVTIDSVTPSQGSCTSLPCNLGTIDASNDATITVQVTANVIGTITHTASVVADEDDPVDNNTDTVQTPVLPGPTHTDLTITKVDSADPISLNDQVTYTITVTNNGPESADEIVVEDMMGGVAANVESITSSQGGCTAFPCELGALASGQSATIRVVVSSSALGTITNTAEVTANIIDSNESDNSATAETEVADSPRLITPPNNSVTPNNQVEFTWNSVAYAAAYEIQIDNNDDFSSPEHTVSDLTELSYIPASDNLLVDDTTYFWRVRGIDISSNPGPWSTTWTLHVDTTRLAPPNLGAPRDRSLTPATTPRFTWKRVQGATAYWLQVSDDPDFNHLLVNESTLAVPRYTVPNALPYEEYFWRAAAQDANGNWSDWSVVRSVTITIQYAPKNGDYSVDTTPTLKWKRVANATRYQLQMNDELNWDSPVFDDNTLTGTRYTFVTPLDPELYYWRMRVETEGQWSNWMPVWVFTVTPKPPDKPNLVSPANRLLINLNQFSFNWEGLTDGGSYTYQIQIDDKANFSSPEQDFTTVVDVTTQASNVFEDGTYFWRVRAINSVGVAGKWSSKWSFTVDTIGPDAPVLVAPANLIAVGSTPEFTWKPSKTAISYDLRISLNESLNPAVFDSPSSIIGTRFTLTTGLTDDVYYWSVRAEDKAGNKGPWSDPFSMTVTAAANPPDTPLLTNPMDGSLLKDSMPDLSWDDTAFGAAQYQIQIDTKANFNSPDQDKFITNTPFKPASLEDGTYFWRVRAINDNDIAGEWSAPWKFKVDTTPPTVPVLKLPSPKNGIPDTTPTFKWKSGGGAVLYWLQLNTDPTFVAAPIVSDDTLIVPSYTLPDINALEYGNYYWRVKAQDTAGNWTEWSEGFFQVTTHKVPKNAAATSSTRPTFKWASVEGTVSYCLQVNTDATFVGLPAIDETGLTTLAYRPADSILGAGYWYWRVGLDLDANPGCDVWMQGWELQIKSTPPKRVALVSPANRALTNDTTPTFTWKPVDGAVVYRLIASPDKKFSLVDFAVEINAVDGMQYTLPDGLADGQHFWRVQGVNIDQTAGAWSKTWTFTVDTVAPAVPDLVSPVTETRITNKKFKLGWTKISDAARYELQIDTDPGFPVPPIDTGRKTTYTLPSWLSQNTYYWRVRAVDKAGNASDWSETRVFYMVAGDTALPPVVVPLDPAPVVPPQDPRLEPTEELTTPEPPVSSSDPVEVPSKDDETPTLPTEG